MKIKKNNNLLIIILLILLNIIFLSLANYSIYETLEATTKSIKFKKKKQFEVKPVDGSLNLALTDTDNAPDNDATKTQKSSIKNKFVKNKK